MPWDSLGWGKEEMCAHARAPCLVVRSRDVLLVPQVACKTNWGRTMPLGAAGPNSKLAHASVAGQGGNIDHAATGSVVTPATDVMTGKMPLESQ